MQHPISLKNVRVHNLKGVSLEIEPNQFVVFTGVSGSGKSSLAFDTIYVEGQRRYVESLSNQVRREIGDYTKPELDSAEGITPTIAIEQKSRSNNPRSTVGTLTEIYDYLRVLYARIGTPHCPVSGEPLSAQSKERIIASIQTIPDGTKVILLAPYVKDRKGEFKEELKEFVRKGFMRVRIDGTFHHLEDPITLDGNVNHTIDIVIDRITMGKENKGRIIESVTTALDVGVGVMSIYFPEKEEERLFSVHAFSEASQISYESLDPQDFSFNHPQGMCPTCFGLGELETFDVEKIIDPNKSISEDCCSIGSSYETVRYGNIYRFLAEKYKFSVKTPWKKLPAYAKEIFLFGVRDKWLKIPFVHPKTGHVWVDHLKWEGVLKEAMRRYSEAKSDAYRKNMQALMTKGICPECHGTRLKAYPAVCRFGGLTISEVVNATISDSASFFANLKLSDEDLKIGGELIQEISSRLGFLNQVGLHYLTLNRASPTLSGGEAQRVRLASQIGSGLVGITYVLDEPSIGLHPRDNHKLIETLKHLRNLGNTVLVVEHDEETIFAADHIVDVGPGPGYKGGQIIVDGNLKDLLASKKSLTGAYLRGDLVIKSSDKKRKASKEAIEIVGASHNNLKNVDVKIPLGLFVAITGVSGSGKSSLILETLYPALSNALHKGEHHVGKHKAIKGIDLVDKVIAIDQTPIGRNPRSNPSTYIKLFDLIRDLFTLLPDAQAKGFKKGQFSFNVKEGSCTTCGGMGMIKVDMDFLEDAFITCPTCEGQRFDPATLSILYKGKSIADVLEMEVGQALRFFEHIPNIHHCLNVLHQVGLDYLKLGQPSPTLSGGEAQRVKLAKELLRPSTGKTVYILDEPTTGLHFSDINQLLHVLHHFVEEGNTVIVIEHNMDVVKGADWVIDLGPEGGKGGGQIIGEAPPAKIAKEETPTGVALRHMYEADSQRKKTANEILSNKIVKQKHKPLIDKIVVKNASQNNLKNVDVEIPRNQITAFCGPSGSGKSSLAFETIYAEGQRKYAESLSAYARQFIKQMPRPHVETIEGLSPAIAIEQKIHAGNPRSTIGTMTEIYDYLRILWAHTGIPHNPETMNRLIAIEPETIVEEILKKEGAKLQVLSPYEIKRSETLRDIAAQVKREGYLRIYLNGQMYHLDTPETSIEAIPYDPKQKNSLFIVIDRLFVKKENVNRIREAVYAAVRVGDKKIALLEEDQLRNYYLDFADPITGESFPQVTPKTFGFNNLEGACPNCQGLGTEYGCNLFKEEEVRQLTFFEILEFITDLRIRGFYQKILEALLKKEKISASKSLESLAPKALETLLKGSDWIELPDGNGSFQWSGIEPFLAIAAKHSETKIKEILEPLMEDYECSICHGNRLNRHACAVLVEGVSLPDFCRLPIDEAKQFIEKIPIEDGYLKDVKAAILNRLLFLEKIGLSYVSLDRKAPTLSGGETQRIRLARQLGSGLTGALYVLDEPTIGLHPRDTDRMNSALLDLKDKGNTLVVVEHDPQTLNISDYLVDFGPGSGRNGGEVIAQGTLKQVLKNPKSLTGQYLTGKKTVLHHQKKRPLPKEWIELKNGSLHNIQKLNVKFPVGLLTCITGVSGSGKSTLIHDILAPLTDLSLKENKKVKTALGEIDGLDSIEQILKITQDPIGLTSRSDVGTYTEVLPKIRELYAMIPDAVMRGLQPKNFSYNHIKGMCTNCWGMGYKRVELLFLPAVKVTCDVCQGMRLNPLSLEVRYQGKNFGDILHMTVLEASQFFANHKRIKDSLDILTEVGLDYVQLGQEMPSLSGGEAQRIKLSRELAKRSRGKTLFLLDEPTIGLHPEDIVKLLAVLQKIVDKGHTIIVIEHNLDVMASSDYIIDMGPSAGQYGGQVVAKGPVDAFIAHNDSYTAKYLLEHLRGIQKPLLN